MAKLAPCLWFDGNAEEAANFYASIFPNSSVNAVNRATAGRALDAMNTMTRIDIAKIEAAVKGQD